MNTELIQGVLIPFAGTSLGAAMVLFMKKTLNRTVERALTGFAAGVMVAASIWSLLIPAIESSEAMGPLAFIPAVIGFWIGTLFLLLLDHIIPHLHLGETDEEAEGIKTSWQKSTLMALAVTLHNIPERMAVGVVFAGWVSGNSNITYAGAMALALGIAIQNFPEGAIISMPLHAGGTSKGKSLIAAELVIPVLPYLLSFAAGAMIYVVVEELIPEMSEGKHSNIGVLAFALGFSVMMTLDVALG